MRSYDQDCKIVRKFLTDNNFLPCNLQRIVKRMCSCQYCKHFVQHYDKDGKEIDYGHCTRNGHLKAVKPSATACSYWDEDYQDQGV